MTPIFILTFREHRKLGYIFTPFSVQEANDKNYLITIELLKVSHLRAYQGRFAEHEVQLIKIIDEISDEKIVKAFSKKKVAEKDFFDTLSDELIQTQIRPYVERKIVKCLEILRKNPVRIFHKLDKTNHIYLDDEIKFFPKHAEAIFNFDKTQTETRYHLSISLNNKEIKLTHSSALLLTNDPCSLVLEKALYCISDIDGKKLTPFFKKQYISVPKSSEKKYYESFIANVIEKYTVNAKGFSIHQVETEKTPVVTLQLDFTNQFSFLLEYRYGNTNFLPNSQVKVLVTCQEKNNEYEFNKFTRDSEWEQKCAGLLLSAGLINEQKSIFKIKGIFADQNEQQFETINWLNSACDSLKSLGFIVNQKIYNKNYFLENISIELSFSDKTDWFEVHGFALFGEFKIPFSRLKAYIQKRIREIVLPNGEIAIIPTEWFAKYEHIAAFGQEKNDKIQLNKHHFSLLPEEFNTPYTDLFSKLKAEFSKMDLQKAIGEINVDAHLREYQQEGYLWLRTLQEGKFGGCLADDMGLGKTIQTIALLSMSIGQNKNQILVKSVPAGFQPNLFNNPEEIEKQKPCASLIVVPTSLIHNWDNEFRKFAPWLKVFKNVGLDRIRNTEVFDNFDIVISSYGLVRNDIDILEKYPFYYIILDESQYIKNPDSKIYKSVMKLISKHRLVLTGTPIENSLIDLWAQMNFLNKGLLGSLEFFKNHYLNPIERINDENKHDVLKKIIYPFILRRKKMEVAKDLPPLNEYVVYCDMSEKQKSYYETEKAKIRNYLLEKIQNSPIERNSFLIIQALMKLRQIANHPVLVDPQYTEDSGKFEEIILHVENLVAENHKILIFSSFVKHLNLLADYFRNNNLKYSYLTGNTQDRKAVIDGFQNDDQNFIFLISIKAGGVGLNLTSADYILLLDPWWNPAVEMQAISRAHRIGQSKKVFVYRFITTDSIEMKIRKLQEKKSKLADIFVNSNNPVKSLSMNDINELLE